jgi:glutamate-1-semialdehyde aminotransferase/spore coat polysaccharide biosynthesis protein SpsF (cytidylyltransferase family)
MVLAIVQARLGSQRFPRKMLAPVQGRPVLWHVLSRLKKAKSIDRILVATTTARQDDELASWLKSEGILFCRGSEPDVLDRYYQAAKSEKADVIVRITGDCPLIAPQVIDRVVRDFQKGKADYVSNTLQATYPDGLDTEVFSFKALTVAWKKAKDQAEREHVTTFFHRNRNFRTRNVFAQDGENWSHLRWTVDHPEDLEVIAKILKITGPADWLEVCRRIGKELAAMPEHRNKISNEGYYLSLLKEKGGIKPLKRSLKKSFAWRKRAEKIIPTGTQTFSKTVSQYVQGVAPVFLEKAKGCRVWDVDGNEYIDFVSALLPVVLGYNYPAVNRAVEAQLKKGVSFSLPTTLEVELSETIRQMVPSAEMVRFGKNGSDATSGAVRVSRAYTGRDVVACCGYHGWQDWYIGTTTRNKGVPAAVRELTASFTYNDLSSLEKIFKWHAGRVACVIMEPMSLTEPDPGFLEGVRDLTHRNGAVLVFDEVITGFRFAAGGAQEHFGVIPDLSCFGKAMANGFPLSAVAGKREIMKVFEDVFFSFTFGGEALSLAAGLATLKEIQAKPVIRFIWAQGKKLQDGIRVFARELGLADLVDCVGKPCWTVLTFKNRSGEAWPALKSLFQQEVIKRGILFANGNNVTYSHADADIERALLVYRDALKIVKKAVDENRVEKLLEGPPIEPVFKVRTA